MFILWVAVLSLHILAAVSWIGGMVFLSLALAPLVRNGSFPGATALFRAAALRFRLMVWSAIAILLTTGPILLHQRGTSLLDPNQWPPVLRIKLSLVALLLLLALTHDLVLGPRVSRISALPASERTGSEAALMRTSRWLPRFALLTAVGVLIAAAMLART